MCPIALYFPGILKLSEKYQTYDPGTKSGKKFLCCLSPMYLIYCHREASFLSVEQTPFVA